MVLNSTYGILSRTGYLSVSTLHDYFTWFVPQLRPAKLMSEEEFRLHCDARKAATVQHMRQRKSKESKESKERRAIFHRLNRRDSREEGKDSECTFGSLGDSVHSNDIDDTSRRHSGSDMQPNFLDGHHNSVGDSMGRYLSLKLEEQVSLEQNPLPPPFLLEQKITNRPFHFLVFSDNIQIATGRAR
jgi:hypothetical protein